MGGSFNPPTRAHMLLMRTALDYAEAETGLFVPVSDAYLKRKLKHDDTRRVFFPYEQRLQMLHAMCKADPRMTVCEADRDQPVSSFYRLLVALQPEYPQARLYYSAGADKLALLEKVFEKTDFPERFGLLIFCRDGLPLDEHPEMFPRLYAHKGEFLFPQTPAGASGISSTEIRRRILNGSDARDLLEPAVWEQIRNVSAEDFPEEIAGFTDSYAFLDNRFPSPVTFDGETYLCAEAAFHASKTKDPNQRAAFRSYSGDRARAKGSRLKPDAEWEVRKTEIMRRILEAKFSQDPDLREKLLATGQAQLICFSDKDNFWGVNGYTRDGENMLGQLLMELREQKREELQ